MAKASKKIYKETVQPPPITVDVVGFELFLNEAEAGTLLKILRHIGGQPKGPRGDADKIKDALERAGAKLAEHPLVQIKATSGMLTNPSIYFTAEKNYG